MKKTNKFRTGILSAALVLMLQTTGWTQSSRQAEAPATVTSSPSSDIVQLRQQIAKYNTDFQNGMSQNRFSQSEIDAYKTRIALLEKKLQELNEGAKPINNNKREFSSGTGTSDPYAKTVETAPAENREQPLELNTAGRKIDINAVRADYQKYKSSLEQAQANTPGGSDHIEAIKKRVEILEKRIKEAEATQNIKN